MILDLETNKDLDVDLVSLYSQIVAWMIASIYRDNEIDFNTKMIFECIKMICRNETLYDEVFEATKLLLSSSKYKLLKEVII